LQQPGLHDAAVCAAAALGRAEALLRYVRWVILLDSGRQQALSQAVIARASSLRMSSGLRELA
jgi:hypothetical protein